MCVCVIKIGLPFVELSTLSPWCVIIYLIYGLGLIDGSRGLTIMGDSVGIIGDCLSIR